MCAAKHMREYFQTGKLPEKGTICKQDWNHFDQEPESGTVAAMDEENRHLFEAVWELSGADIEKRAWLGI
jgi:hypothetical protein